MPLAPNSLLQAAPAAKPQAMSANPVVNAAGPQNKAPGFAQVFASESGSSSAKVADTGSKPARDKAGDASAKQNAGNDKGAAARPAVADSGNTLPATATKTDTTAQVDKSQDDKAGEGTDPSAVQDPTLTPVDPALLAQAVATVPATAAPVETPPAQKPQTPPTTAIAVPVAANAEPAFDPEADPLDALPVVRLAMEQGGHVSASSQAAAKSAPAPAHADQPTSAQSFAAGMASMLDQQAAKDSTGQGGEKAFGGLIEDGLKELKNASSDTRVDDFANRLAALTQAVVPKTANALPPSTPLAMHQSGWTEEVVNRVMYLSSANLKSADIQLQPAELGRLDIRVNIAADQQTQINFMSGHAAVREALEGQMHRLRDMLAQQGMGQVDVNVSDQSRGWQGQPGQEQQQQNQARGLSGNGGRGDGTERGGVDEVAEAAAPVVRSVIGSSVVDYYA